jgi:hypothetical protein
MKNPLIDPSPEWVVEELYSALCESREASPRVVRTFVRSSRGGKPVHVGWLLASEREDVVVEKRAQPGAPVRIIRGERARKIRDAEGRARSMPELDDPEAGYELRALRVPRLYLDVLWLHSPAGTGDWVIPYATFEGELQEGKRYTLQFFSEAAKRLAARTPACPAL